MFLYKVLLFILEITFLSFFAFMCFANSKLEPASCCIERLFKLLYSIIETWTCSSAMRRTSAHGTLTKRGSLRRSAFTRTELFIPNSC